MLSESKRIAAKRNYLMSFCSANVVKSILFDDGIPTKIKEIALPIARELAKSGGRSRVYLEDWEQACKEIIGNKNEK